jgi:hypothetical protein
MCMMWGTTEQQWSSTATQAVGAMRLHGDQLPTCRVLLDLQRTMAGKMTVAPSAVDGSLGQ